MTAQQTFRFYIWLVDLISRSNGVSLEEINDHWANSSMSDGESIARSNFLRYKEAISNIFGINIVCVRDNGYKYVLEDRDLLKGNSVQNWMISTLSTGNVLTEGLSLNDRILPEPIPSSGWLREIIDAMKSGTVLKITYKKYSSSQAIEYEVEPYSLKAVRRRWYMLCIKRSANDYRVFSLDRIVDIEKCKNTHFELRPDFSASAFFKDCYGIVHGTGTEVERIVLRAYGLEAKQMGDLPMHHSQTELPGTNDKFTDYELILRPTNDFISVLLERGKYIRVLEPLWLADKVAEEHKAAAEMYTKSPEEWEGDEGEK